MWCRYLLLTVAVVAAAAALSPASAAGHAAYIESQPEAGTRLESGPGEISLRFTEPLNLALSQVDLTTSAGEVIPAEVVPGEDRELIVRPQQRLERDAYEVTWQTVSTVDGHTLQGSFSFGVQTAPAATEGAVEESPLARDGWIRIASRALLYAALFFFAGGVLNAALLSRGAEPAGWVVPPSVHLLRGRAGEDRHSSTTEVWTRTIEVGWLALGASVGVAVAEASDAAGGLNAQGVSDYLLSNAAGFARVGTIVAIAVAVLLARSQRVASAVAVAIAFLSIALSGHANSADPRALTVLSDWVHLMAAAIWIGGIAQIALAWVPAARDLDRDARRRVIASVLPRFGRVALPAFLVVAASGSVNALIQLGGVSALWETAYGRVLAAKMALVGLIALASYGHAMRLRPRLLAANPHPDERLERRHWRLLGLEPWLGLAAIVAVAALVAFPLPPSQLGEAGEAEAAAPCDPCPLARASGDELPVAEQAGSLIAAAWLRRDAGQLSGTLRILDSNQRPVDAPVMLDGGELEACGEGCWRLTVTNPRSLLRFRIEDSEGEHVVSLPTRWQPARTDDAEELLARAQAAMRDLATLRVSESLTSGIPGFVVRSTYRYKAPDRIAYRTSSGTRLVAVGKKTFESIDGSPFKRRSFGADGFQFDNLFRWTVYGRDVRWLQSDGDTAQIALYDEATPVWYRLTIDRSTLRIVRERMIAGGHFMRRRYHDFNQPLSIQLPR